MTSRIPVRRESNVVFARLSILKNGLVSTRATGDLDLSRCCTGEGDRARGTGERDATRRRETDRLREETDRCRSDEDRLRPEKDLLERETDRRDRDCRALVCRDDLDKDRDTDRTERETDCRDRDF